MLPVASAASSLPPMGITVKDIGALKSAGAAPRYASFWAGEWMASSGWGGFDSAMRSAKSADVTPVVYWYYWGDSISPDCVRYGCNSRNRAEWTQLTGELASHLRTTLGGAEVLVVLENEFNKGGITDSYAPTFDGYLADVARTLDDVPGVKIVLGFGGWGESSWGKFPKSIAASDYIGFQAMRASTRDSESSYRAVADRSAYFSNYIAEKFNKPSFLYDLALSSYPDSRWERIQAETLDAIFAKLVSSGSTGLQGIVYRSLDDTYMSPSNYYGYAESHWGLRKKDGSPKPAFDVWLKYAKGSTTSPTSTSGTFSATFSNVKGNSYWVQTDVTSSQTVSAVCAMVDGGSCKPLEKKSYGWAASFYVRDGSSVVFRATSSGGATATSGAYKWPDATPISSAPTTGTGSFSASFTGVKGNSYWVQTDVTSSQTVSAVCAMVDGGSCKPLEKKSYGWAASFYVRDGSKVVFRATSSGGETATSGTYEWPSATLVSGGTTTTAGSATFSPYSGNEWWVQTKVSSSQSVKSVCARIDGGSCQTLSYRSWGAWAASIHAPTGSRVVFEAKLGDGSVAKSGTYTWPVK